MPIAVCTPLKYNKDIKEVTNIHERIKAVREALGLSQREFAERIHSKQVSVSSYERGARVPLDPIILSICREFNVNEHWLRTGEGSMFIPSSPDAQLFSALGDIALGEDSFKRRFILALAEMPPENWQVLEDLLRKALGEEEKEKKT